MRCPTAEKVEAARAQCVPLEGGSDSVRVFRAPKTLARPQRRAGPRSVLVLRQGLRRRRIDTARTRAENGEPYFVYCSRIARLAGDSDRIARVRAGRLAPCF